MVQAAEVPTQWPELLAVAFAHIIAAVRLLLAEGLIESLEALGVDDAGLDHAWFRMTPAGWAKFRDAADVLAGYRTPRLASFPNARPASSA